MTDGTRDGLAWEDSGLGPEPQWTREPDIRAVARVCRRALGVAGDAPEDQFRVRLHADGAFNKLYSVQTSNGNFMMRVALPVDPGNKTRGEAATLQLLRRRTGVPVPAVVAFDDSRSNEIGYEWLLMSRIPGTPVYYHWRKMSMAQKEALTARVAELQAELFRCGNAGHGFRGIGTLGVGAESRNSVISGDAEPGPVVSGFFFTGARFHYPIPRGPFRSSHDWLRAHLNVITKEHTAALAEARNEDGREFAESSLRVARKLLRNLHKIFPAIVHPVERTVLWHNDLSLRNLMVNSHGGITGIIGWECVSAVPRWVATQVPEFLRGAAREVKPDRNCYTDVDKASCGEDLDDGPDNEGKTELYWIHLMEYEQTQLRKVYAARMRQLRPEWDTEVEESALKVDFLQAVLRCGSGFYLGRIEQWIDAVERGEFLPLMEVLRVGIKKVNPSVTTTRSATSTAVTIASRLS
ncbi:hypothetical protein VTK26DRAFT_1455 [Humicola hyalothermophila]